jgi:hypothetical protein
MAKTEEREKEREVVPIVIIFGLGLSAFLTWLLRRQKPNTAVLFGQVTDADTGIGIEGISVDCDGYSKETDANGNYRIANIPAGTYTVRFTDPYGRYEGATV